MSRMSKLTLFLILLVFVLACNLVTSPINDAQQVVETVQSVASAIPIETLQAIPTAMQEIEMPTGMPDMPDVGNVTDPQDPPLSEWNGIPVMPEAISGGESSGMYSYKVNATVAEVFSFYKDELVKLGWSELFTAPDTGSGALLTYEKGDNTIVITIASGAEGEVLVFMTHQ